MACLFQGRLSIHIEDDGGGNQHHHQHNLAARLYIGPFVHCFMWGLVIQEDTQYNHCKIKKTVCTTYVSTVSLLQRMLQTKVLQLINEEDVFWTQEKHNDGHSLHCYRVRIRTRERVKERQRRVLVIQLSALFLHRSNYPLFQLVGQQSVTINSNQRPQW